VARFYSPKKSQALAPLSPQRAAPQGSPFFWVVNSKTRSNDARNCVSLSFSTVSLAFAKAYCDDGHPIFENFFYRCGYLPTPTRSRIRSPPPCISANISLVNGPKFVDNIYPSNNSLTKISDPIITSKNEFINIHMSGLWGRHSVGAWTSITSAIVDNGKGKTGLRISGRVPGSPDVTIYPPSRWQSSVRLEGSRSNTFTGDTIISDSSILWLSKTNGAQAIGGNILIEKGSGVVIERSDQILDSATVTLDGRERSAGLCIEKNVTEKFHRLVVKGDGILSFHGLIPNRILWLDDLLIESRSILNVAEWRYGTTKILVRKDSKHLQESLEKVNFMDHLKNKNGLIETNYKDYYEIVPWPTPEPAVYGAGLALTGLGVLGLRRKSRSKLRP